jgi:hypothetical protein
VKVVHLQREGRGRAEGGQREGSGRAEETEGTRKKTHGEIEIETKEEERGSV